MNNAVGYPSMEGDLNRIVKVVCVAMCSLVMSVCSHDLLNTIH